ncbi:hypothetical protein [Methylobacterium sp. CCH5-D2]|uniref:hypothetical protein n=1 Tax=Methylobacterium sp. CCH5-D2 TaxID=1768765 RepID=UPI00082CD7B1|nr:hypothetical protein [Methylobacterium sp. CCH5-D2]
MVIMTIPPELPADIEAEVVAEVSRIVHASRRDPMVTAERVEGVGGTSWDSTLLCCRAGGAMQDAELDRPAGKRA